MIATRWAAVLCGVLAGCATARGGGNVADDETCRPPAEATPVTWSEALLGRYQVTVVATSGAGSGRQVTGELLLWEPAGGRRAVYGADEQPVADFHAPAIGTLHGALDSVGAVYPGSAESEDPDAPGVLVMVHHELPGVMLRVGSGSNRRGPVAFDGSYFTIGLHESDPTGFRARWRSAVQIEEAGGYLCAVKLETPGR